MAAVAAGGSLEIVASRYGYLIARQDFLELQTSLQMSEAIFNFTLMYINERHQRTTSEQTRHLGYRRVLLLTTEFFQILSKNDVLQEEIDSEKAATFLGSVNVFMRCDYLFIPICFGEEYALATVDLNNKALIYFGLIVKDNLGDINQNPVLRKVYLFVDKEYQKQYKGTIAGQGWKFVNGGSSKTDRHADTPVLVLIFANLLALGNFVFTGISEAKVAAMRNKIIQLIKQIGVTKDHPSDIQDFSLMPF